jgi:hypothetical protein
MIEKKEKKGNVDIYHLKKDYEDSKLDKVLNRKLKRTDIDFIIDGDADVYNEDGKLLLRFRKNKLNKEHVKQFYDNVIKFAVTPTSNRGSASGSKSKNIYDNPKIMSNIIGYFDKLSPKQKLSFRNKGIKLPKLTVRETRFLIDYPENYKKLIPLIKDIDKYYKQYAPEYYDKQKQKANQTPFRIANTAFTTVTTNVNYQTTVHTDKGDDIEGFGNLAVIEHGDYEGGETCFPQYGIGVDVRTGDVLYMDVHQPHGNLPVKLKTTDSKRLSIVCYLRKNVWEQSKGKSKKFMAKHIKNMNRITRSSKNSKNKTNKTHLKTNKTHLKTRKTRKYKK